MTVLDVQGLSKVFYTRPFPYLRRKKFIAVNDISFSLRKGEVLGFLGPNGAGKTTTIEMLLGTLTPSGGQINYFGKDFAVHRSDILQKVTFSSSYIKLPSRLTIYQNLDIFARLYGVESHERAARIKQFLERFDMWQLRWKKTGALSAGQLARVMLAKAFIPHPDIMLLDEPTAALDPEIAAELRHLILEQRDRFGVSVLFTSHNMEEVTQLCDRVLVLKSGQIIADNTPLELARSVAQVRVCLLVTSGYEALKDLVRQQGLICTEQDRFTIIEVDEQEIAQLLQALAVAQVHYDQIFIEKPTLEDYFLSIVNKGGSL